MNTSNYRALPEPVKTVYIHTGKVQEFYPFPSKYGSSLELYSLSGLTKNNVPDKRMRGIRLGVFKSKSGAFYSGSYVPLDESKEVQGDEIRAKLREAEEVVSNLKRQLNELYAQPEQPVQL